MHAGAPWSLAWPKRTPRPGRTRRCSARLARIRSLDTSVTSLCAILAVWRTQRMDDPCMLKPHTNDDRSAPSGAGSGAAWLAQCGMVALLAVEEPNATRNESSATESPVTLAQEPADANPDREPEEALLIR